MKYFINHYGVKTLKPALGHKVCSLEPFVTELKDNIQPVHT